MLEGILNLYQIYEGFIPNYAVTITTIQRVSSCKEGWLGKKPYPVNIPFFTL